LEELPASIGGDAFEGRSRMCSPSSCREKTEGPNSGDSDRRCSKFILLKTLTVAHRVSCLAHYASQIRSYQGMETDCIVYGVIWNLRACSGDWATRLGGIDWTAIWSGYGIWTWNGYHFDSPALTAAFACEFTLVYEWTQLAMPTNLPLIFRFDGGWTRWLVLIIEMPLTVEIAPHRIQNTRTCLITNGVLFGQMTILDDCVQHPRLVGTVPFVLSGSHCPLVLFHVHRDARTNLICLLRHYLDWYFHFHLLWPRFVQVSVGFRCLHSVSQRVLKYSLV
jgi:hypothetical protein